MFLFADHMNKIIGIDLGTTYSVVAYMDEAGPRLIPNALGSTLTASVVGIDEEGKLLVGQGGQGAASASARALRFPLQATDGQRLECEAGLATRSRPRS